MIYKYYLPFELKDKVSSMPERKNLLYQKGFFLIVFLCLFIILTFPESYGKDKINLNLKGRWEGSNSFCSVEVIQENTNGQNSIYAFCGTNKGLLILNITDPNSPKEISSLDIGHVYDLALCKVNSDSFNYIASANGNRGIVIIDISDITAPYYAGGYDTPGIAYDVTVNENHKNHIYIADWEKGLIIIDISNPDKPTYAGGHDTHGWAGSIALSGNYAYVADWDEGLVIIDISDPTTPLYKGGCDTPGHAHCVAVKGNYAYVADGGHGMMIIDITNPTSPSIKKSYETQGDAQSINIYDNYAIISDIQKGVIIIDISNPTEPVFLGGHRTQGFPADIANYGKFAYIADQEKGLLVIDISKLKIPSYKGEYETRGKTFDVMISGNYAYVADGKNGLVIIDISDQTAPLYTGGYDTSGEATGVTISKNYAYIADGDNGLIVIDITDPNAPSYIGKYDTLGNAFNVAISENYAYVADGDNGLVVIDITNPGAPSFVDKYDTLGNAFNVAISENYAYVADGDNGLVVIDITNPIAPSYIGKYDIAGKSAKDIAISNNYAYLAYGESGLIAINISDPTDLTYVGMYDTQGDACGIHILGNYAYVADKDNGLVIVDIADPDPRGYAYAGGYMALRDTCSVHAAANYAYVADEDKGLVIIDITGSTTNAHVGGIDAYGYVTDVVISEDHAYVANGESGLIIINIYDPTFPFLAGNYDTKDAFGVAVHENNAYVADWEEGLIIIDISNPTNPIFKGKYSTKGNAYAVTIAENYAYMAYGESGLVIIDITDPNIPVYAGEYDAGGYVYNITLSDNNDYAYLVDWDNGFEILDITTPIAPSSLGKIPIQGNGQAVAISGNYAYVAYGDIDSGVGGLKVIDISIPTSPSYAGKYQTPYAFDVVISGNYAYVADALKGIVTLDISDPNTPIYVGGEFDKQMVFSIAISGNHAYVTHGFSGSRGLTILEIVKNPLPQGNLILCVTGPSSDNNPLWCPYVALTNFAYSTFAYHNYPSYSTYYINPQYSQDVNGDRIFDPFVVDDADPAVSDIEYCVKSWAYNRLNNGPLYIYLAGRGSQDGYQVSPGQIIKPSNIDDPNSSLEHFLNYFQKNTGRDIICILEFSHSGSFGDDLIDPDTTPYSRTVITCADNGSSFLNPDGDLSFTRRFLELLKDTNQPGLFEDTGITHQQRVHLLQGLFSRARDAFWAQGHPFNTQPPQMVTAKGAHTLCSISLTADPFNSTIDDSNTLIITDPGQTIALTATGNFLDGQIHLDSDQIHYQSSDLSILSVTTEGIVSANSAKENNGKAYILATIIDPNFTQATDHDPDIPPLGGVTGRVPITIDIPSWQEKENLPLAIIVAGEKQKRDSLWLETHTIANYAYLTFLGRGYSRKRIQYLTHLKEELRSDDYSGNDNDTDLDGDKDPNNDIDGIPSLSALKKALDWVKDKGTDNLTLLLVNHGIEEGNSLSASGGFYLKSPSNDPDSILSPETLDLWLDELQEHNKNLKITLIIECCHSGLFINHLSGENRIIITSTKEGESYLYAHGLVSFSYYLFTYLQSGADMATAYASAHQSILEMDRFLHINRQTLNEPHQRPQLDNRPLARTTSLGGPFLITQDQPIITSVELSPDPNTISLGQAVTIQVRASDLDCIDPNGVWAVVNATYSPPVFSGDPDRPIVDLPEIALSLNESGAYEGTYSGFTHAGPYTLLIFAQDKKGTVSIPYMVTLNVSGQEQTRALLLAGWDPSGPDRYKGLLYHGRWVLEEKGFSQVVLSGADGTNPTLEGVHNTLTNLAQGADQLFVYLIGQTQIIDNRTVFPLNGQKDLDPDTLNDWLDDLPACKQVILVDAPGAQSFFRSSLNRIYLWSAATAQPAYLGQGGYCAFSHFFFTCIYQGANIFQAYQSSHRAIMYYSYQEPCFADGQGGELAKATYLGSPFAVKTAGPRLTVPPDQAVWGETILWAEVNVSDPNVWCLINTPHKGILHKTLISAQGRYETSYTFDCPGSYEVITYAQDPNGLIDYDVTYYDMVMDIYEVDDSAYQATPILINDRKFPQFHNFHNPNDVDWIFFYAYPDSDRTYEVYVDKKGDWKNCPLEAALYTLDGDEVLHNNSPAILKYDYNDMDRIYPGCLLHPGYYLIKFYYGCPSIPQDASTLYEVERIIDNLATGATGTICGHVLHSEYHNAIGGAKIKAEADGIIQAETISGDTGVFFLFDLREGNYQVYATATGYNDSPKVPVELKGNSEHGLTIYLASNSQGQVISPSPIYSMLGLLNAAVPPSYVDREKEYTVTLQKGMNLFSCPCQPFDCDSNRILKEAYDSVKTYYQENNAPFEFFMGLRRHAPNGQWQACFIDTNRTFQGEDFDLDPYEGYLAHIDIRDPNNHMKSLYLSFTCNMADPNKLSRDLNTGFNLLGFLQPSLKYHNNSHRLFEDPDLKDTLMSIFHYSPQKGSFYPHYRLFGQVCGRPCQFTKDRGYCLFTKEKVFDWQLK